MLELEPRFCWWKTALLANASGSQLLEFAVALPLLVVFVVGIFDFGAAFNLKQKLNNIAREGARFASSLPPNDLDAIGTPPSVTAIRDLVETHLQSGRMNDCGLATQTAAPGVMTWTYTAAGGGCPLPLVLKIERSYSFPTDINGYSPQICFLSNVRINEPTTEPVACGDAGGTLNT